jgi:RNA polymerase sigma-70 factor (ECF subfamily)
MKRQPQQFIDAAAITQGDKAAFAELFEQNRDKLLALAYRLTSSAADAEDVVQDAFVSSWRHHDQFQGAAKPSTWLYRVTFNAALMRLRTRRRKGADSLDALPGGVAEALVGRGASAIGNDGIPGADDVIETRHRKRALRAALADLKPVDQELMQLRYGDELSTEEVAEKMGMSASAVKTRLHRARQSLRDGASLRDVAGDTIDGVDATVA